MMISPKTRTRSPNHRFPVAASADNRRSVRTRRHPPARSLRSLAPAAAALALLAGCRQAPTRSAVGDFYRQIARPEVWQVVPNSQAEDLGMKPGDLLLLYNRTPVRSNDEVRRAQALALAEPGPVPVTVLRGEDEVELLVKPGPLGGVPVSAKYPSSLAVALRDILGRLGRFAAYDWLAALTGESFTFTARADECRAWWSGGKAGAYLDELGRAAGLSFRRLYDAGSGGDVRVAIRGALAQGQSVLVRGGWPEHRSGFWGVAVHYDPADSLVYGYSLDSAEEMPLSGAVEEVYAVRAAGKWQPPQELLRTSLRQALELAEAYADTGWQSGVAAYDLLVLSLETVPFCPVCGRAESQECFDRLVRTMVAHKESENRFLEDMKLALPDMVGMLEPAIAGNEGIIGRLQGILHSGARLGTVEDQRKLGLAFGRIQLAEAGLIAIYEQLLGSL